MKKAFRNTVLATITAIALSAVSAIGADEELKKQTQEAIKAFTNADSSLKKFFDTSAGYAIFPTVGRGGFIVGGQHGTGLVYEKGKVIGEATVTAVTIGAQIGGEAFYEVIFFETSGALFDFKQSKWEMRAEVNAVAASEGASKVAKYRQGVAVFTLPRGGLMAQATVGGQKFDFTPIK